MIHDFEHKFESFGLKNRIEEDSVLNDETICQLAQECRQAEEYDPVKDVRERMKRDNVSNIFKLPRGELKSSTSEAFVFNKPMMDSIKSRDTSYVAKKDGFTLYNEELLKFKDNIRS